MKSNNAHPLYRLTGLFTIALLISIGCRHAGSETPTAGSTDSAFVPLFNGKDLTGWEGNTTHWSAENGEIVGKSTGIKQNEFLVTSGSFGDFVLKFKFRLVNNPAGDANSGMQFRSERVVGSTECYGYQADIGQHYWGSLYDESRRRKTLARPTPGVIDQIVRRDGWNEYVITCQGSHIMLQLNGITTVDYMESAPPADVARTGRFALQIHSGEPMEIHVKEIWIKRLND